MHVITGKSPKIRPNSTELRYVRQGVDVARTVSALALAVGDMELRQAADKHLATGESLLMALAAKQEVNSG